jgi:hypothetical protein
VLSHKAEKPHDTASSVSSLRPINTAIASSTTRFQAAALQCFPALPRYHRSNCTRISSIKTRPRLIILSSMADSLIPFHHNPLDHTIRSLRLVHLVPELSQTGHIECTITHTTTTACYVCLSYTWDDAEPLEENWILVGGKRLPG